MSPFFFKLDRLMCRATLQLRIQVEVLGLLFFLLYIAETPAATSEGLLRAAIASGFGLEQANLDVWEGDATCDGLGCQVRDWFTLIAVDAIGLGRALDLDEGAASDHPDIAGSMLGNKDTISQVQLFLND